MNMKKLQTLLIGSLILNAGLFATIGMNSKKATETHSNTAETPTASPTRPQEKSEVSASFPPSAESRPSFPSQASQSSRLEANSYAAAGAAPSSPVSPSKVRRSSGVSAQSSQAASISSGSPSTIDSAPLPVAGSVAPAPSSLAVISIPTGPGNSITYRGQQAAITASRAATDSQSASLDAVVTPVSEQSSNSGNAQAGNSSGSKSNGTMSFDDQLFRTKWGWEAYDQARKAAALAASASATPGN